MKSHLHIIFIHENNFLCVLLEKITKKSAYAPKPRSNALSTIFELISRVNVVAQRYWCTVPQHKQDQAKKKFNFSWWSTDSVNKGLSDVEDIRENIATIGGKELDCEEKNDRYEEEIDWAEELRQSLANCLHYISNREEKLVSRLHLQSLSLMLEWKFF